jgi:hypothetical protein
MARKAPALMTVLGHERSEDAFAQAAVGNPQALAGPGSEQRLEDGAAREHKISSLLPDARLGHAFGVAHANEVVGHDAHVSRRKPTAIDTRALIDRQLEMNA